MSEESRFTPIIFALIRLEGGLCLYGMRQFLLAAAVVLTVALWPATFSIAAHNGRDGHPAALLLVVLCLLRGVVLTGAGVGFGWATVMEVGCMGLLIFAIDGAVVFGWRVVFGGVAFLGPLAVMAGMWLGMRNLVLAAVGVVLVARLGGWAFYRPLTAAVWAERNR